MSSSVWIVLGIAIGGVAAYFILSKKTKGEEEKPSEGMLMLQNQMNELARKLDRGLGQSTEVIQKQFGESAKIIREVTERLTKLDETNRQVVNFAEQLRKLQDVLQNPKQRGILGEYYLETVLKNVLPPGSFQMQYNFKDGNIVDAVVFVDKRIIPIDSKFSLENYNRILETHNVEEKKKYEKALVPDLKTRIDETSKFDRVRRAEKGYCRLADFMRGVFADRTAWFEESKNFRTSARHYKTSHILRPSPLNLSR